MVNVVGGVGVRAKDPIVDCVVVTNAITTNEGR
jgi:hypothetical protein